MQGVILDDFDFVIEERSVSDSPSHKSYISSAGIFLDSITSPDRTDKGPTRSGMPLLRGFGDGRFQIKAGLFREPPVTGRRVSYSSVTLEQRRASETISISEQILASSGWFTDAVKARMQLCEQQAVAARIGGTWWGMARQRKPNKRIVVFASHSTRATANMVDQALSEANATDILLVAPKTLFADRFRHPPRVDVLRGCWDPWLLIEGAECIHVAGDAEEGFIARMLGVRLQCHTPGPLLSTSDTTRLMAATVLLGTRYINPFTLQSASCEEFIAIASEWRKAAAKSKIVFACVGVSSWKRRRIAEMFSFGRPMSFRRTAHAAVADAAKFGGAVAVWASRAPTSLDMLAKQASVPVMRIEDGFIRSVGLGSDFLPPLSVVLDDVGLYYDATRPSGLEKILAETDFDFEIIARAARLRSRIVREGVTKYNLVSSESLQIPVAPRVILVPGQVADDRSVLLGGCGGTPGLDLLRRVREQAPDAYIIFKPHPDIEAGHRTGIVPDSQALAYADQILRGGSMNALLAAVDEVHTLTSLAGFEALLRGKKVTTYGQPFYAGWGLTTDITPSARRIRRLTLDQLVAGTLLLYPIYIDPVSRLPCGPETVLDRMAAPAQGQASLLVRARRLHGRMLHAFRMRRQPNHALNVRSTEE